MPVSLEIGKTYLTREPEVCAAKGVPSEVLIVDFANGVFTDAEGIAYVENGRLALHFPVCFRDLISEKI